MQSNNGLCEQRYSRLETGRKILVERGSMADSLSFSFEVQRLVDFAFVDRLLRVSSHSLSNRDLLTLKLNFYLEIQLSKVS